MMYFKKIITFLILLLVLQFIVGCRPVKNDYMPFDGFGPDGRSKRAYEQELSQTSRPN